MNFEVAELLKFWTEKIIEIDPTERERPNLGLLLEKMPEVISVPRSNKRVELKMGNGNDMLITNLGNVWKLLRPSWCPHTHASLIEEVTERVRLSPAKDEDLGNLNVAHKLILPHRKESEETRSKLDKLVKKMERGSCQDVVCGGGEFSCDGRSCVRIQSFQKEELATWFGDITEKEKSEVQIVAKCYASTTVNIATALGLIRGLGGVVICVYGPAVTYAFSDPLVAAYRQSVVHVSLISVLHRTTLNWCRQEDMRERMSETVLFGKIKDPELIVLIFRGQLQCRMGGKREGPIEFYPKFWNLNPIAKDTREVLSIPALTKSFNFTKREL